MQQEDLGYHDIYKARADLAKVAQEVLDNWDQDEQGFSQEYGAGGVCDDIARQMIDVLAEVGFDVASAGQPGDDHAFVVAYTDDQAWYVDIPANLYEVGGGYKWQKIEGVELDESDVSIYEIPRDWVDEDF